MAEAKVGITLVARDKASSAIKKLAGGVVVLNQSLDLAGKAFGAMKGAVSGTIGSMMELRGADDALSRQMEKAQTQFKSLGASLGETLAPAIVGISTAIGPTIKKMQDWFQANRKVITMGLIEWISKAANFMNTVLTKAIIYVNRAWAGLGEVINVLKIGFKGYVAFMLKGYSHLLGGAAKVVGFFNKDMGASVEGARDKLRGWSDELKESAKEDVTTIGTRIAGLEKFETKVNSTSDSIRKMTAEITKTAKATAEKIVLDLSPTPIATVEERLRAFEDTLPAFHHKIRANLQDSFTEASQENIFALDQMAQKLGLFGAEVGQFGTADMPRLIKKALELGVISEKMALKLEADPSIFVGAMGKAVGVATASVGEIKGQLAALKGETDRIAGVIGASVGAGFSAAASHATAFYKMREGLADMEESQEKDLVKMKQDLRARVSAGEISSAEMTNQLRQKQYDDSVARYEAEEEATRNLYRGIRDQLIQTGIEFTIQQGVKYAAGIVATKAKSAEEVAKTSAAASGAAARGAITTAETTAEIGAAGASGASQAIAAHAGIPFVGIGIGLAAAAVIVAAISKYMGAWGEGGFVTGGTRGKDSVPGLLMPGEYVMSVKQVDMWKRLSTEMGAAKASGGSYANGGPVVVSPQARPRSGATAVNVSFQSNQLPNRAETKRWIRSTLSPALKELGQQGMLAI